MAESPDSTISTTLRLTKALGLARQGNLKSAELLLAPENTVPENVIELHALAALVTYEGDSPRALRLWRLLLQKQPDHPEARRMIPMLELWLSRPPWHRHLRLGAGVLATVVLCAIALWAMNAFMAPTPTKSAGAAMPSIPAPMQVQPSAPASRPIQVSPAKNLRTH